jgi:chromosome segregation ATPase
MIPPAYQAAENRNMASPLRLHIARDHGQRTGSNTAIGADIQRLQARLAQAEQEIAFLTAERDELVDALRDWSQATPEERMELLLDHELARLRHELNELKRSPLQEQKVRVPRTGRSSGRLRA